MNDSYGNHEFSLSEFLSDKDVLTRHKWPEEKPEKDGQYLIRIISPIGSVYYRLRGYEDGEWHSFGNYLTHWWNLPEVTE